MLRQDDLTLIDTVFHELLHSTVWHETNTTFNESLATYVGRAATLDFLEDTFPDEPERVQEAVERYADIDLYNAFISRLYDELEAFYASDLTPQEKVSGREAVYQAGRDRFVEEVQPLLHDPDRYAWAPNLPTNNAWMLSNRRYNHDLDLFDRVHDANGRDWSVSLDVFNDAAQAADPNEYLRNWLDTLEGPRPETSRSLSTLDRGLAGGPPVLDGPVRRGLCPRITFVSPQAR
jgi:predicted aminopeptidase